MLVINPVDVAAPAQGRVLVIDDDPRNCRLMHDLLTSRGYTVEQATDGERGLALAAASLPDVILLDSMMPAMDGRRGAA